MTKWEVESLISQLDLGFIARMCLGTGSASDLDFKSALDQVRILDALTDALDARLAAIEISAVGVDANAPLQDNKNHELSRNTRKGT